MSMSMDRYLKCRAVTVVAGLALAASAHADGFRNPPPNPAGLGAIGARYTLIDDASASAYNPANLLGVDKSEVELSLTAVQSDKSITQPGVKTEIKDDVYLLPSLFSAIPLKEGRSVLGVAITTPFGQATEFEQDSAFRYSSLYFAEMRAVNLGPVLAYRVSDSLDVAIGLNAMWSDLDLRQVYPWGMVAGNPALPDGRATFEGDGLGWGGSLGLTWRPAVGHRIGLSYKSAMDVDYEGDFKLTGIPAPGLGLPRSDFESTIQFPNLVGLGYSIELSERLSVGAEVEWIEWSRYEQIELDVAENAPLVQPSVIPQDWDDAFNAGVGAVYKVNEQWTARFGYIFLQTPVPDQTLLPSLPENDQHVISAGLGYAKDGQRISFAYGLGLYEDRTISDNQNPAYNGKYEFLSHLASVSYALEF